MFVIAIETGANGNFKFTQMYVSSGHMEVLAGAGSCVDMWVPGTIRMDHVKSIYDR